MKRKNLSLVLVVLLLTLLVGCGNPGASGSAESSDPSSGSVSSESSGDNSASNAVSVLNIAALKGPTAMGLVKLMHDSETSGDSRYAFSIAASADEITPALIQGELDFACVPANLASVLWNRTEGGIVTLAVNTLGVLYIVENGESIQSMEDLRGMTIAAAGKGATPEYALRYLLAENGLDPDADVTIDWKSEHSECVAALASGTVSVALLPQPFVTVARSTLEGLRVALDLTKEWDALENGSALLTGVIVARKTVVEDKSSAIDDFLTEYKASVEWVNGNVSDAAALVGEYGIVEAAVAEKAIPQCNIVCLTGKEMQEKLTGYLEVLYEQNPESVGGALPTDGFCYGA